MSILRVNSITPYTGSLLTVNGDILITGNLTGSSVGNVGTRLTNLESETIALKSFTSSFSTSVNSILVRSATTGSNTFIGNQTVSGSILVDGNINANSLTGSIDYNNLTNIPSGIVSSSNQLTSSYDARYVLSGSITQTTWDNIASKPAGIVSGSSQITISSTTGYSDYSGSVATSISASAAAATAAATWASLSGKPEGIVSGSSQITATSTTGFATGVKTQLDTNTVVSGSGQINVASTTGDIALGTRTSGDYVASMTAGTGITVGTATGEGSTPVITNTGVTSNVAGTGVTVSGATGAVTISIGQAVGTASNVQFNSLGVGKAASATAGRIEATQDIVAYSSSDRRFKENITPIQDALDKINQISGITFDWKEENKIEHGYEGNDVGVIAQEIEGVLPQLVQTRENGYKAVKYEKLVALLIEGIKELHNEITLLKSK